MQVNAQKYTDSTQIRTIKIIQVYLFQRLKNCIVIYTLIKYTLILQNVLIQEQGVILSKSFVV